MCDGLLINFKRMKIVRSVKIVILIALILLLPKVVFAKPIKIFMVQSYSEIDLCGVPQLRGAMDTLKRAGFNKNNAVFYTFFMRTKTLYTTRKQMDRIADKAYNQIISVKPDIVFLFDDNAFRELAPKLINTHCIVVFSGINVLPEDYNKTLHFIDKNRYPIANITGVYEKLHVEDSIKFVQTVLNKKGNVTIISSADRVGKIITKQIQFELNGTPFANMYKVIWVKTTEEYKRALENINDDNSTMAYILNTQSLTDNNTKKIGMPTAIPIALQIAKKPDIIINSTYCKFGLFGGVALNFYAMGSQAAEMAIKILQHVSVKDIRIEDAEKTNIVINAARAEYLKIKIPISILNSINEIY